MTDTAHGFMVQSDAIAQGMTTALRRGFNGKSPRLTYSNPDLLEGTSPNMLVTYADGTQAIVPARATRKARGQAIHSARQENTMQARRLALLESVGYIGNVE